ncbi:MAG: flagellin, partial [Kiritimatiellae bacterium]|nr:flagellin [Kiritimatiellia bacterium]
MNGCLKQGGFRHLFIVNEECTLQVYNNINAFSTWRSYNQNVYCLRQSMNKLSSGLRITRAGDDPAGLAMSERLRAQYRNTAKAASNVENKINYLQTADAWLQKIHDMTGRMAELAVMANDGTKSQVDRDNLQKEFAQMQKEIKRITSGATAAGKFNGLYLFRGGNGVPMLDGDMVEGSTSSQYTIQRISGSASLTHDYQAVYDYSARTWEVRDITTNSVVGTMTANPRDGTELYFSEGGSVFHLQIEAPTVGGYQEDATIHINQAAMREATASGMQFAPAATEGSASLTVSGSGTDITRASWSATYDGTQWVLRNETTHTDVATYSAPANESRNFFFIEGANGFNVRINTPGNGTAYSEGDRFTWSNENDAVGTPVFYDATPQIGSASVSISGDGYNISTAPYRATYDGVNDRWTVINTETGTTVA